MSLAAKLSLMAVLHPHNVVLHLRFTLCEVTENGGLSAFKACCFACSKLSYAQGLFLITSLKQNGTTLAHFCIKLKSAKSETFYSSYQSYSFLCTFFTLAITDPIGH